MPVDDETESMSADSSSSELVPKTTAALLGALIGVFGGPVGVVAGAGVAVGLEFAFDKAREHWRDRTKKLGEEFEALGNTKEDLLRLVEQPSGLSVAMKAAEASAATTNDTHVRSLAMALHMACSDDPSGFDVASVLVETLARMTDTDMRVLGLLFKQFGFKHPFAEQHLPPGIPLPLLYRLVGLGLISFDGLAWKLTDLALPILGVLAPSANDDRKLGA